MPASAAPAWISWASCGISWRSTAWSTAWKPPRRRPRRAATWPRSMSLVRCSTAPSLKNGMNGAKTWSLPITARPWNSVAIICSRSNVYASAWRAAFSTNCPVRAAHPDLAVRRGLDLEDREVRVVEQGVAAEHGELDDGVGGTALDRRDHRAELAEERAISWPSSGVWPPHQSGLRSNVAPGGGVERHRASTARCRSCWRRAWSRSRSRPGVIGVWALNTDTR